MQTFLDRFRGLNRVFDEWCSLDMEYVLARRSGNYHRHKDGFERYWNTKQSDAGLIELKSEYPSWIPGEVVLLGATGLNPVDHVSVWCGLDVDSALNHGNGLDPDTIQSIIEKCSAIPYVRILRSKSGLGLHLFGRFDPENLPLAHSRAEHKQNASRFVMRLEADTGIKFIDDEHSKGTSRQAAGDVYGSALFLWTSIVPKGKRKLPANAFKVEKSESEFIPRDLPDAIPHKSKGGRRRRVRDTPNPTSTDYDTVNRIANRIEDSIESVAFDDGHKAFIGELQRHCAVNVDEQNRRIHFHSYAPKLIDRASLGIVGTYETDSPHSDLSAPNSYGIPLEGGGWLFGRFGNVPECKPWFRSRANNVVCLFNVRQSVEAIAVLLGAVPNNGKYLGTVQQLADVLRESLGAQIEIEGIADQDATLRRDGKRYVLSTSHRRPADPKPNGWHKDGYSILFFVDAPRVSANRRVSDEQSRLYYVMSTPNMKGERAPEGFLRLDPDGGRSIYSEIDLELALKQFGFDKDEREHLKANVKRVQRRLAHFRPIIEGDWYNGDGARLKVKPADHDGSHSTWDLLDDHIGRNLTPGVLSTEWCRSNGIATGGQFLRLLRCIWFQHPDRPTPMLTLFSDDQNTGKTTYVNSLQLLVENGIAGASMALKSNSQFNANFSTAWLVMIQETNIGSADTYDELKKLITDEYVESQAKHRDTTTVQAHRRFIQTCNRLTYCPIQEGDTRIIVVKVPTIEKQDEIPPDKLKRQLADEAPYYLRTLLKTPIPESNSRLWLPIIDTPERNLLLELRTHPLKLFMSQMIDDVQGASIPADEFHATYHGWRFENLREGVGKNTLYYELRSIHRFATDRDGKGFVMDARWKSQQSI